ncbi:serine protease [Streptomyces silvisoli]|uniref:NACHT domain-containing protein n=1 Tax=Streptomyces silvisoli TaxID=3034235 RepID=A0ABT5ZUD5_9ACTN|nr:serine protease [Streptomyces silvisoli]MDF3292628.1 NACHT domain-containing protein [Streptomyces silvisoli]
MSVPRHPGRTHLVAVTTANDEVRGSGYLLNPRLVLTAGHVVANVPATELQVCRLQTLRSTSAEVLRIESDVALLLTAESLADPDELPSVEMSELASDARFDDCSALGLPAVMTRATAGVAPLEVSFRIAPNSADIHGYLSLELLSNPPQGPAPWRGMSGAPVFHAGRWLVGVIVRDSADWGHSRLEAVPIGAFFDALPLADAVFRVPQPITESEARDVSFLDAYRKEVIRRYGHIELFGLGMHGHLADDIGIEHAYVSLHAGLPTIGRSSTAQERPVEQLIPKNTRLLLRGDPGAGKSTLLEWLAVSIARRSCAGPLEPFNERVPFLIRLRDMYAPRWKQVEGLDGVPPEPEQFLHFNRMANGSTPPDGWVRRMLDQDRALLLVDGLDEVLEAHRDRVLRWINQLLRDFPSLHIIVTGRPEALHHWNPPDRLGFVELKLLELNEEQRAELIHKWHQAAILGVSSSRLSDEERGRRIDRLSSLEAALTQHINASEDLSALAATPLLCAVLCKLHEVHGTRLPRFRQELYARTIDMMLGLRDADREVPDPLPHLDVDQRRAILSWIAGYLTTEGEREIPPERFDEKVQDRLRSLGREAGAHSAEDIRKALQERSGLLVAPSEELLRFSHRTFQDYLAATDMVAQRAFGQLASHAGEEAWDDVLHFAMSQCNLADTGEFVAQLRRKLRLVSDRNHRARMRMAAASCIPYAVQMSAEDRESLIAGVAKSFRTIAKKRRGRTDFSPVRPDFSQYAAVGPDLLAALQRDFDWQDPQLCINAVFLAGEVGGPEALRFLARIPREQRQELAATLAAMWDAFPGPDYVDEVLAGLDLRFLRILSLDQFAHARAVGEVKALIVQRALPIEATAKFAEEHGVQSLHLRESTLRHGISLAALSHARKLTELDLGSGATGAMTSSEAPPLLPMGWGLGSDEALFSLPPLPGLKMLTLMAMPADWAAQTAGWTSLTHLWLFDRAAGAIGELRGLPALTELSVASETEYSVPSALVHPGVTRLALVLGEADWELDLAHLPSAFPALTDLLLVSGQRGRQAIDLAPLQRVSDLRIWISGVSRADGRIRGAEAFTNGQVQWHNHLHLLRRSYRPPSN